MDAADEVLAQLAALKVVVAILAALVCSVGLLLARLGWRRGGKRGGGWGPGVGGGLELRREYAATTIAPVVPSGAVLNVLDFGAKPDDSTDCSVPFQNACDAMKDGDFLFFPAGTYRTTQTVDVAGRGVTAGRLGGPKLIRGVTLFGTRSSVIHHDPGTGKPGFGHRVLDVCGPRALIRDLSFVNAEAYPHTGAGANINLQKSAEFTELAHLHFHSTGQNAIVVCSRGVHIHDCTVTSSPEHGVYLSGGAYDLQQPSDTRIVNNHFENIAKNGIQVQNANADAWVLEGTIIEGNTFRNVHTGVFISESYVGLELQMPIQGKPPLGPVKGGSSGAMARVDEG